MIENAEKVPQHKMFHNIEISMFNNSMPPAANYGPAFTVTLLNCYKEFLKFLIGIDRDCILAAIG